MDKPQLLAQLAGSGSGAVFPGQGAARRRDIPEVGVALLVLLALLQQKLSTPVKDADVHHQMVLAFPQSPFGRRFAALGHAAGPDPVDVIDVPKLHPCPSSFI